MTIAAQITPPRFTPPRFARVAEVRRVIALLRSVKADMPIREHFASIAYIARVHDDCRKRRYWIVEVAGTVAGVMLLRAPEIFYIAVGKTFRRLGIAHSLIVHAKLHHRALSAMSRADNRLVFRLMGREGFHLHRFLAGPEEWISYSWSRPHR